MAPASAAKRPKLEPSASASTSAAQHQYQRGDDDYVPGNIVEIELCNFMTYDRLVCRPGPRLNLVVGPNGFGKSSLVCAITLVLAADPSIHGRASSVGLCPPEARDLDRASDADHPGGGGGRGSRWKGASWLRAILPRRGARRRDAKEGEEEEPSRPSGALDPHPHPGDVGGGGSSPPLVERRASFRRSCEWMVCREPPGGRGRSSSSLDPPRHS
ncbi:structural maintenance of chromosomes protein 5 isoform x2 [Hordeum vulgare]|nr:structural maintenance of chromosomes protein 5 isoform x2 [Hordeum vulgare]